MNVKVSRRPRSCSVFYVWPPTACRDCTRSVGAFARRTKGPFVSALSPRAGPGRVRGHETARMYVESSKRLSVLVLLATTAGHPTAILQEPRWLPTY